MNTVDNTFQSSWFPWPSRDTLFKFVINCYEHGTYNEIGDGCIANTIYSCTRIIWLYQRCAKQFLDLPFLNALLAFLTEKRASKVRDLEFLHTSVLHIILLQCGSFTWNRTIYLISSHYNGSSSSTHSIHIWMYWNRQKWSRCGSSTQVWGRGTVRRSWYR